MFWRWRLVAVDSPAQAELLRYRSSAHASVCGPARDRSPPLTAQKSTAGPSSPVRPRPEARSFREPSLVPANPLLVTTRDFLRDVTAIATLDRDGRSGGVRFGGGGHLCGHLFGTRQMCLGLTRCAPARQSHQSKRHHVLRLPSKSGRLKGECKPGIQHLHLQRRATPTTPTTPETSGSRFTPRSWKRSVPAVRSDAAFRVKLDLRGSSDWPAPPCDASAWHLATCRPGRERHLVELEEVLVRQWHRPTAQAKLTTNSPGETPVLACDGQRLRHSRSPRLSQADCVSAASKCALREPVGRGRRSSASGRVKSSHARQSLRWRTTTWRS